MTVEDAAPADGRAARRRRQRGAERPQVALAQLDWRQLRYVDAPTEPLDAEALKAHLEDRYLGDR